jgi:NodT family efflux transporter outer membrane factor (OMF) lipoprotein
MDIARSGMSAADVRVSLPGRRVAPLLLAALLGACSFAPHLQTPDVPVADHYKELGPWTTAEPADELPRDAWWRQYGDDDLDTLQDQLAGHSPDLAAALARYRQAQAASAQLNAALFPSINANASLQHNHEARDTPLQHLASPLAYNSNIVGLQAAYELDLWGRIRNSVAAGKAQAAAAGADLESARLSLQAQLADDYMVLRQLDQQIALLNDSVTAYAEAADLTRQRFDSGIAPGLDLARAQNQLDETRSQVLQAQAQRALMEHAIAALIGEDASRFSIAPRPATLTLPRIPAGVPSTLLQRRPDVAAAQRRMQAANAGIGVARAAYFPDVTLSAAVGFESNQTRGWIQAPNTFWSFGPSAALSVFDAGLRRAQVAQARAQFDETAADYRRVALSAFQQIEDNLALLEHYHAADGYERSAVSAAQQALDYSLTRYRAGAINYLDVVVSQTAALQSQIEALDIATRQLRASVQLIRALGGGWQPPPAVAAR